MLALIGRLLGWITPELVTQPRPNTSFIWHPDKWSFIVALVAGAAGALALAIQKTATMVGVFISVTTVPAAGNLALGLAVWNRDEIAGSLAQLGINIAGHGHLRHPAAARGPHLLAVDHHSQRTAARQCGRGRSARSGEVTRRVAGAKPRAS